MEESFKKILFDPVTGKLVMLGLGFLVIAAGVHLLKRLVGRTLQTGDARYRARKFVTLFGYLAALLLASIVFSSKLGQLTVAFGVAGAGIAFALQEVIASVAGWGAVSFGGFYSPGDRVQLGGIKGDVIDIGILRTTLMECGQWVNADLYNGRIVRVANSFVFKEPVFNYSADFPFLWDEIVIPVKYGSDRALARELFLGVAHEVVGEFTQIARNSWDELVKKYLIEDAQVGPVLTMVANDNWIEYTLRYVVDYKKRRSVKDRLFTGILDRIDASGGRVGLASATFHLVEAPVFDVRVTGTPGAGS